MAEAVAPLREARAVPGYELHQDALELWNRVLAHFPKVGVPRRGRAAQDQQRARPFDGLRSDARRVGVSGRRQATVRCAVSTAAAASEVFAVAAGRSGGDGSRRELRRRTGGDRRSRRIGRGVADRRRRAPIQLRRPRRRGAVGGLCAGRRGGDRGRRRQGRPRVAAGRDGSCGDPRRVRRSGVEPRGERRRTVSGGRRLGQPGHGVEPPPPGRVAPDGGPRRC